MTFDSFSFLLHMPDVHPGLIPAIMQGAASFELETNAGIQQYKHLNVPEDAGETEIRATLQAAHEAELRREVGESREMLGAIAGKLDQLLLAGAPLSA